MDFESQISFLYYKDIQKACEFYEKIFDFDLEVDQGWAKIYKTTTGAYVGLVDETKGHFDWQKEKTVMITLVTSTIEEVDMWYKKLKDLGVKVLFAPKNIEEINIRAFLFEDPEGYVIEIQHFIK